MSKFFYWLLIESKFGQFLVKYQILLACIIVIIISVVLSYAIYNL